MPERRYRGGEVQWGDDHSPDGKAWPIRSEAISPGKTSSLMIMKELDQSAPFRRTDIGCTEKTVSERDEIA
jgi:hypothetical protein